MMSGVKADIKSSMLLPTNRSKVAEGMGDIMLRVLGVCSFLLLCSCVTAQQDPADPTAWGRIDCKRGDDPAVHKQFDQSLLMCRTRAQAAGVMGTAAMPVGYGTGGAIASGINRAIARTQISEAAIKDCMAQEGYVISKKSEFATRCSMSDARVVPSKAQ